jgi:flagellar motor component MotA
MKKMYMLYLLVAVALCVSGILIAGGSLLWFCDAPSLIFTPVIAIILLLGHFSPGEMIEAFKCAGKSEKSESELKKSLLFFETFQRLNILSGILGFMLGLIMILISQELSNEKVIGPYFAVAFLTMLYSLVIMLLITVPFQSAIKKKLIK